MNVLEAERQKSQKTLDDGKSLEDRRKHGQFATPYGLAREIISYGLDLTESEDVSFLEPAAGTGAFLSALTTEAGAHGKSIKKITGVELDVEFAKCAERLWKDVNAEIINGDFTRLTPDGKYNFLVTNPPYVRHHYMDQNEKIFLHDAVKEETGAELSGLSDLFCYFLLLSHKWLKKGAVCGWLI
ncbi:MAG: class I SAM-dependent methyltransferase, partial [Bacteroidales bacterium]|nr:class I SAM-dependent methyltransferase [Bacteroidales bacterium]